MLFTVQIAAVLSVLVLTYLIFQVLGPRPASIFLTRGEKTFWDSKIVAKFGSYLFLSNFVASITSLATVYIFFIGNSKIFGYWILVSVVTVVFAGVAARSVTNSYLRQPRYLERLNSDAPSSAVLASLFWAPNRSGMAISSIIKWLSITNILCIIWLEFSVFSDLSGLILLPQSLMFSSSTMFIMVAIVFYFTLRNGLRGFLFADLLHAPMVLGGSLILLTGVIWALAGSNSVDVDLRVLQPKLSATEGIVFVIATIFLNSFLTAASEAHWVRVWSLRRYVISHQVRSALVTSATWTVLIVIGLLAGVITTSVSQQAVAELLSEVASLSPVFVAAFWVAGVSALFSTSDAQIYSALLVFSFQPRNGSMTEVAGIVRRPFLVSLILAALLTVIYALVRAYEIPFEKLIFLLFPIFLNAVPAIVLGALGRKVTPAPAAISICLYAACSVAGLLQSRNELLWTLAAPLMPAVVTLVAIGWPAYRRNGTSQ
ncbi:SLC5/6 family protein [Dongia sp. agr-C8]